MPVLVLPGECLFVSSRDGPMESEWECIAGNFTSRRKFLDPERALQ